MRGHIIDGLVQGSASWHYERDRHITSSDAAVLTGNSPFHTPLQLYEHKLCIKRFDDSGKEWLFEKGHAIEAWAREIYERDSGLKISPVVVVHPRDNILMSSLDGATSDLSRIVEIKYVGARAFDEIASGKIPPHHLDQVQFHLLVSGADCCDYIAAKDINSSSVIIEVKRVDEHCAWLEALAHDFWRRLTDRKEPNATDRDYKLARDAKTKDILTLLKRVNIETSARHDGVRIRRLTSTEGHEYTRYILEVRGNGKQDNTRSDASHHGGDRTDQEESRE